MRRSSRGMRTTVRVFDLFFDLRVSFEEACDGMIMIPGSYDYDWVLCTFTQGYV